MGRRSAALVAVLLLCGGGLGHKLSTTAAVDPSSSTGPLPQQQATRYRTSTTAAVDPSSSTGPLPQQQATRNRTSTTAAVDPSSSTGPLPQQQATRNRTSTTATVDPSSSTGPLPQQQATRYRTSTTAAVDPSSSTGPLPQQQATRNRTSTTAAVDPSSSTGPLPQQQATRNRTSTRPTRQPGMHLAEHAEAGQSGAPPPADDSATTTAATMAAASTTADKVMSRIALDWEEFKKRNGKSYLNRTELNKVARMLRSRGASPSDLLSDEDRMGLFAARKMAVEEHNKNAHSPFRRTVSVFADMITEEVIAKHTGLILRNHKPKGATWNSKSAVSSRAVQAPLVLPRHFDWRERGALTEARDQGPCGCCWAFAATAAIEARIFIRTRKVVALSEQNLLDCDNVNDKCDGGTPWDAFDWVQANGGQEENEKYPYEVLPDVCRQDKARMYRLRVKGYMSVTPPTEENIMTALYLEGPLAVAVNPMPQSLQDYRQGVYVDPDCGSNEEDLLHAMLLVGWGEDPDVEGGYWILRNSWGRQWGDNGYIRIRRKGNLCGVMTYAVFPSLE